MSPSTAGVNSFKLHDRAKHVYSEASRVLKFKNVCEEKPANAVQVRTLLLKIGANPKIVATDCAFGAVLNNRWFPCFQRFPIRKPRKSLQWEKPPLKGGGCCCILFCGCFPAGATSRMFSRGWQQSHVFSRLVPFACFCCELWFSGAFRYRGVYCDWPDVMTLFSVIFRENFCCCCLVCD